MCAIVTQKGARADRKKEPRRFHTQYYILSIFYGKHVSTDVSHFDESGEQPLYVLTWLEV